MRSIFGIEGSLCDFKVAVLQLFTVMLQALGKLQIMGGIVSFAIYSAPETFRCVQKMFLGLCGFPLFEQHLPKRFVGVSLCEVGVSGCCHDGCGS